MTFRNSKKSDIDTIMHIISEARESIGKLGIDQWQYGYPSRDILKEDIVKARSYVCEQDGEICGIFTLVADGEPTYEKIYDGQWLTTDNNYYALHRIAVAKKYRGTGVSRAMINFAKTKCRENGISSIRVDTHEGNLPMRKMLEKNGFTYCGKIYLLDGHERVAYEIKVKKNSVKRIYDISRELLSAYVYPGRSVPTVAKAESIKDGGNYNVSDLNMCVHNATHIEAPLYMIDGAPSVNEIALENCVGEAYIIECAGVVNEEYINNYVPLDCCRLLIKGKCVFPVGTAKLLAQRGIVFLGVESQSLADGDANMSKEDSLQSHREILEKGIAILKGIDLSEVPAGKYELSALPIKIAGCDGSPCRANLIKR